MSSALPYLLLFPKWWYITRSNWWWQRAAQVFTWQYTALKLESRLQTWQVVRQQWSSDQKPWLSSAILLLQLFVCGLILTGVVLILASLYALWCLWPISLLLGIIHGGWSILAGIFLSFGAFSLYWQSYVLQPKQTVDSLDPADVSVSSLTEVSTHAANQIYKTLPPSFSSAIVMKRLATDPLVQRIFQQMDLPDQQILPRLLYQATKNSQVVSLKDFCRQTYNQALILHHLSITTADVLLGLVKVVPTLQQILADLGVQYQELVQAAEKAIQPRPLATWWHDDQVLTPEDEPVSQPEPPPSASRQLVTDLTSQVATNRLFEAICWQDQARQVMEMLADEPQRHLLVVSDSQFGWSSFPLELAYQLSTQFDHPFRKVIHLNPLLATSLSSAGQLSQLEKLQADDRTLLYLNDMQLLTQPHPGIQDILAILGPQLRAGRLRVVGQTTPTGHRQLLASPLDWIIHFRHLELGQASDEQSLPEPSRLAIQQRYHFDLDDETISHALNLAQQHPQPHPYIETASQILDQAAQQARQAGFPSPTRQDLLKVVQQQTGLPAEVLVKSEEERLDTFDQQARQYVVGQTEALETVLAALSNNQHADSAAKASFVFVGPSGVGKTELAKTLARTYYGTEDALIRIDIAEFQQQDPIEALFGSLENQTDGRLSSALRLRPASVVFFDNLEKASSELLELLVTLLRQGSTFDSAGRIVSLQQAVVITSTTIGARAIEQAINQGYSPRQIVPAVKHLLTQRLPSSPLLDIVDQIVVFRPLSQTDVAMLVKLMLEPILQQASEQGIVITVDDEVIQGLAEAGYDAKYGARPLRHLIQDKVENALNQRLKTGQLRPGTMMHLDSQTVPV